MAGKAFDFLLNRAVGVATETAPNEITYPDKNGNIVTMNSEQFMDSLSDLMSQNGLHDFEEPEYGADVKNAAERRNAARSMTFALHAINNINMAGKIKANIDSLFEVENVQHFLEEQGYETAEQKEALRNEVKKHVDEKLAIKTSSREANSFVNELQTLYNENYKDNEDKNAFLKEGLAYVYSANQEMKNFRALTADDTLHSLIGAYEKCRDIGFGPLADKLSDGLTLSDDRATLADEAVPSREQFKDISVLYGTAPQIKLSEFLEHAKSGEFTDDEKSWAANMFDDIKNDTFGYFAPVEFKDIMKNGKPMFSENELKKNPDELSCKIVENMLKGEDVSAKNPRNGEITHITPKFEEVNKSRNFFQMLFDLIVEAFTKDKAKEQKKVNDIKKEIAQKEPENKINRERMSFGELMGSNDIKKVTAPPAKTREKTLGNEM